MEVANRIDTEKGELRSRLDLAVEKAKVACERLEQKTIEAAKATDKTIREHPYQTMGVVFGLGMLVGALVMRSRQH